MTAISWLPLGKSINDEAVVIPMPEDAKLWSPDFPFFVYFKGYVEKR
mgnify:CR=1 FL=1